MKTEQEQLHALFQHRIKQNNSFIKEELCKKSFQSLDASILFSKNIEKEDNHC